MPSSRSVRGPVLGLVFTVVVLTVVGVVLVWRQGPGVATTDHRIAVGDGVELDATLWVPASATSDTPASAVLVAHGFGGSRDAVADDARVLAEQGHVVLAWSSRGFGASGGEVGLQDPAAEVADVGVLVDWLAARPEVARDAPGDPRVGMTGASYGGGATLLAGAAEPRLDALVAVSAWHSLVDALSPNASDDDVTGVLKVQWASGLFASGASPGGLSALVGDAGGTTTDPGEAVTGPPTTPEDAGDAAATVDASSCGRFTATLCAAWADSAEAGRLDPAAIDLLARADLAGRLGSIGAPTLVVHARDDTLFPLDQSLANARGIAAGGTPVALRWLPGGHGIDAEDGNTARRRDLTATWFARWLDGDEVDTGPVFASVDREAGEDRTAERLPTPADPVTLALSADGGLVAPGEAIPGDRSWDAPPGGVPAALTSLPGLAALGDLLPPTDLPGQHVAFTSPPLADDVDVLGGGTVRVGIDATTSEAVLFAKVLDIAPDGRPSLPQQAVAPVRLDDLPTTATITLPTLDHTFAAGHRVRLVLAATDQAFDNPRTPGRVTATVGPDAVLALPTAPPPAVDGGPLVVSLVVVAGAVVLAVGAWWVLRRRRVTAAGLVVDDNAAAVDVRGLRKVYANGFVAVDGVDLRVERGQVFGLLGPNGAGKTSTLRMVLGLVTPTAGEVRLLGHRVGPGHAVLGHVGALVEGPGFAPYRSGLDNLRDFWRAGGQPMADAELDRALEVAALGEALHRPVGTYSHGMRQRLGIAQALLGNPTLLVLDEPTDGLDPGQIRGMRDLLSDLATEGRTVLVSSHLLAEVEQVCTHAAVLVGGRVVASGPVAELGGEARTVEVRTDQPAEAAALLAAIDGVGAVRRQGPGVLVDLGEQSVRVLVASLVEAGIGVRAVTPRRRLEDAFLQLVDGGGG